MQICPEVSDSVIAWDGRGHCLPAIVIDVDEFDNPESALALFVIDPAGMNMYRHVPYGVAPSHWSWPEDAKAIRDRLKARAQQEQEQSA